jgi:predicted DCC family thiol-disulfide oxidoreductase YuxK
MGIATVHYLSMNAHDGQINLDHAGTDYEDVEYTYELTSLQADTDYTISWGDDSSDTSVTTDEDGAASATHTYADPDDYTIVVTDEDGKVVASEVVTIAIT